MDSEKISSMIVRHETLWEVQNAHNATTDQALSRQDQRITALEKRVILLAALASGGGAAVSQLLLRIIG